MNAALLSSKKMDYCTPQDFFDQLNDEFGFVLDAAATAKSAKCPAYYTPETDGLKSPWNLAEGGAVFCNPPYGRETGKWVRKAYEESRSGTTIVLLIPAEQTQHIFTTTYTGKRKSGLCAGGYASPMKRATHTTPPRSRQWWSSTTESDGENT